MRFLIDMPLSPVLATWLVERGHDAVHAVSIGLATSSDTEIIETARRARRTIVTADLDYPRLLAIARATEPSLILFGAETGARRTSPSSTSLTVDPNMHSFGAVTPNRRREAEHAP